MREVSGRSAFFLAVLAAAGAGAARSQVSAESSPLGSYLTLAVGPTAGALNLYAVADDGSQATPALAGAGTFQFLPIELTCRLDLHRFDATRPRLVLTDDGRSRVVLPDGTSIFRFRRGVASFGFLAVAPDGLPRVLIQLPGTGPGGTTDSFSPFLAASRDGTRAAVSTTTAAGDDVWLLAVSGSRLAGGAVSAIVTGPGPLALEPESIAIASGALFFAVGDQAVYRAPTDGSAPAVPLLLPPSGGLAPIHVEPEFAVSDDGSTVALLAGQSENLADLYFVRPPSGPAVNLTQSPGEYQDVGYAPFEDFGPTLALAPDGTSVAYLRNVGGNDELFLRPTLGGAPVQITPDPVFEPSIDNVVVIVIGAASGPATQVDFAAGGGGALDQLDAYRADTAGGLNVVNLTGTSGSFSPPFLNNAAIAIADAFTIPNSSRHALVSTSPGGGFTLYLLDPASGTSVPALGGLSWLGGGVGPAGGRIFFEAVGYNGAPTVYSLVGGPSPSVQVLGAAPPGVTFDSLTPSPTGGEVLVLASAGPGVDTAVRFAVPSGAISLLNTVPFAFSRSVAFSPAGRLAVGVSSGTGAPYNFLIQSYTGGIAAPVPAGTGYFLR